MPRRSSRRRSSPGAASHRSAPFNLDRVARVQKRHRLSRVLKEATGKNGRKLHGFEKERAAKRYRKQRTKALRRYAEQKKATVSPRTPLQQAAFDLEHALSACAPGTFLASFADPLFVREFRERALSAAVEKLSSVKLSTIRFYTLVSAQWRIPASQLPDYEPKASILEPLRVMLSDAGLARLPGWAMVSVHGEYFPVTDEWQLHTHCVVVGQKSDAFEALRELPMFTRGPVVKRPVRKQRAKNLPRPVSHLFQPFWPVKKQSYRSGVKSRLPAPRDAEWLIFIDRQRFKDLVWLHRVDFRDGKLVETAQRIRAG